MFVKPNLHKTHVVRTHFFLNKVAIHAPSVNSKDKINKVLNNIFVCVAKLANETAK